MFLYRHSLIFYVKHFKAYVLIWDDAKFCVLLFVRREQTGDREGNPMNHVTAFSADLVWNRSWLRGVLHENFMRLV